MTFFRSLLVLAALAPASSLLVQPRLTVGAAVAPMRAHPSMQFGFGGGGDDEKSQGLTRDNEPDEFFKSSFDDLSDAEKLKSPAVVIGLGLLIAPFIVGAIALAFYR